MIITDIIDLHCDTLNELDSAADFEKYDGHINLEKLEKGGSLCQCFAIFINDAVPDKDAYIARKYSIFKDILKKYGRRIAFAENADDILKNKQNGKISAMLTIENCGFLNGDINKIKILEDMRVRIAAPVWNNNNCISSSHSDTQNPDAPLTPFGREFVYRLNYTNIIPDVSHMNTGGFFDLADIYKKPFFASHSGAYSLVANSRNLTDAQLKVMGDRGCVAGINFYGVFANGGKHPTRISDIVRHALYIKNTAGDGTAALGSDFDGFEYPLDFNGFYAMQDIADMLSVRLGSDYAEKVCFKNALRLLSVTGHEPVTLNNRNTISF